jgi:type VI protein secretion system component VasK
MAAYDYPLMGAFWTMMWFFLWIIWLMLLFRVFGDIFRSDDLGGFGKTLWMIFVVVLPFLGLFVYLIARGKEMGQREIDHARAQQQEFDSYVRDVAAPTGSADELAKLADLRNSGVITDAEFQQQKAKLLA